MSSPHKLNVVSEETETDTENGDSDEGDYTNINTTTVVTQSPSNSTTKTAKMAMRAEAIAAFKDMSDSFKEITQDDIDREQQKKVWDI